MRKIVIILALMLAVFQLKAQQAQINREVLDIDVLAGISTFSLDGQVKVFEAPMAIGLKYKQIDEDVNVGLYVAPVIDEGQTSNSSLSTMLYVTLFKDFGCGFGYKFWKAGIGMVEPKKENLFLSFNFSLIKFNVK